MAPLSAKRQATTTFQPTPYILNTHPPFSLSSPHSISYRELRLFVYRVWRSQLDRLDQKLLSIDPVDLSDTTATATRRNTAALLTGLRKEREELKAALKRNYSRAYR